MTEAAEYTAFPQVTAKPFNLTPSQVTKMVFMIVVSMMISTSARAEWTQIKGNNHHRFYIDFATIRINGTHIKAWSLVDFTAPQQASNGVLYLSIIKQNEFDCSEEQLAERAYAGYSGNMAGGEVIATGDYPYERFKPVIPNSIGGDTLKTVCDSLNQRK